MSNQKIVAGPSKLDLMLALFDRKSQVPRVVDFELADGEMIGAVIDEVGVEDGSGESWLFKGRITAYRFMDRSRMNAMQRHSTGHINGHYRTDRREGHVEVPV